MELAKKLLQKYGWKEGEGLGKNRDGIAKPLRANMKFDNSGLGTDRATEFNDHWWERCFNEASSNLNVNIEKDGEVAMNVNDAENGVEITTKSYSSKKLKKAQKDTENGEVGYANFLYSSTLTNTGETISNPDKIALDDIALRSVKILSDDELFKACGGLTAHKGARHGLKLSGKLKRLQQQEEELMAKINKGIQPFQSNSHTEANKSKKLQEEKGNENQAVAGQDSELRIKAHSCKKSKKNKKRKHVEVGEDIIEHKQEEKSESYTESSTKKKKRCKSKGKDKEESNTNGFALDSSHKDSTLKLKKKKKKSKNSQNERDDDN